MITIKGTTKAPREPVIGREKPSGEVFRCSSLDRLLDCPGSHHAEKRFKNESNPAAESGTRCHRALSLVVNMATMSNPDLLLESQDAQIIAHNLDDREAWIVRWFSDEIAHLCQEHGGVTRIEKELPLKLTVISGNLSGHYDLALWMTDGTVHLIDYKTGRLSVSTAEETIQGQGYALMFCREHNLDKITVHIIAAGNDEGESRTECTYYLRHLEAIYATILDVTQRASDPHAPRIPGDSPCKYCAALGTEVCPESVIYLDRAQKRLNLMLEDTDAMFNHADAEEVDKIVGMILLCERAAKKMKPIAKKLIKANPERSTQYGLGKPRKRRKWRKGVDAVKEVANAKLLTKKAMADLAAGKLSVGDIENAVCAKEVAKADAKGERPLKKLDVIHGVSDALKGCIVVTEDEAPLQKVKG